MTIRAHRRGGSLYDRSIAGETRVSELRLIGAGRQAEVFEWDEGRVLRLAHATLDPALIEREAVALEAARRAGAPVPRLYERVEVDGRPGLVIDRLGARDLLVTLTTKPWRLPAVARTLGAVHASIHEIAAPEGLPPVRGEVEALLHSSAVPDDRRERALEVLRTLPDGDRLCHCDYHPGNLLPADNGHLVVDWPGAARGDPAADVARARVLILRAALPPGVPFAVRRMIGAGRQLLVRLYMREYRRHRGLDPAAVAAWERVLTVARLGEAIDEERAALLKVTRG